MKSTFIDLPFWQLLTAYVFIAVLLVIVRVRGIQREKEIIIATVRMTLQLVLIGYVLVYVLEVRHPAYTILLVGLMEVFAIQNILKRTKSPLSRDMKRIVAFSMGAGTLISIIYFMFVVIRLTPWFEPRYFITIGGMIIGNSMTGISLGINRLVDDMRSHRDKVETALMLGATPQKAVKTYVNQAFDSAILPTINSMVGMGIVFLPGMMTGQVLSGISPMSSIKYQIAIMLGIVGSVSLTVILFIQLGYKTFFTDKSQLK